MSAADPVLEAAGIHRTFRLPRARPWAAAARVPALRGVGVGLGAGERLGIVGESGAGKSTLARLLLALDRPQAGEVRYRGSVVSAVPERELRDFRRNVQIVFQDPVGSLDPRLRVRELLTEPLRALGVAEDHRARVRELLDAVALPQSAAGRYPHEFSGGQRQRIAIARALAPRPEVLVADEPVSALDVSVRAQILNLLLDLGERFGLALVLISHDLSVVHHVCDRVVVMHRGEIVETAGTEQLFADPQHPYTRSLLAAIPTLRGGLPQPPPGPGATPSAAPPEEGCGFADRCPLVHDRCLVEAPALERHSARPGHAAACHLAFVAEPRGTSAAEIRER